ncbi:MAG: hypothetical protein IPP69_02135 [Flavobacteriales bacterium]|nr:hypothetical protein [Flavobacteriales bacterium]
MKKQILFFASTLTVLLIVACKHHPDINGNLLDDNGGNGGNDNPPDTIVIINTDPCDPDTVYFQNTILPLLQMSCAIPDQPGDGCHDAVDHAEGVRLYDYAHIMNEVVPGNLNASELWDALHENGEDMMPPADYGGPFSAEDMAAIQTWILQGALNNGCTEDCDPTQGSFAQNVLPIIEQTCQGGCHAGANPSASLSLVTYAEISASALDGSLMSSLLATDGYAIMPDNTTGLPECYITQIQNWIDAGAPNN